MLTVQKYTFTLDAALAGISELLFIKLYCTRIWPSSLFKNDNHKQILKNGMENGKKLFLCRIVKQKNVFPKVNLINLFMKSKYT